MNNYFSALQLKNQLDLIKYFYQSNLYQNIGILKANLKVYHFVNIN